MNQIYKNMIAAALDAGLLKGAMVYAGATYPCNHSPIIDTPVLTSDGGGFSPQRLVTIVISADYANHATFTANRAATLTAADGREYAVRITSIDAAGNPCFVQLTARHESQGA